MIDLTFCCQVATFLDRALKLAVEIQNDAGKALKDFLPAMAKNDKVWPKGQTCYFVASSHVILFSTSRLRPPLLARPRHHGSSTRCAMKCRRTLVNFRCQVASSKCGRHSSQ